MPQTWEHDSEYGRLAKAVYATNVVFCICEPSDFTDDTTVATSDGMPNLLKYALGLDPLGSGH